MHTAVRESNPPSPQQRAVGLIASEAPSPEGLRDTLESIVVAFILAFVFRAFLVEAFVIPTGSMAPSLYGKHGHHRCPTCQYSFAYGIREPIRLASGDLIEGTLENRYGGRRPFSLRCPNCRWAGEGNTQLNDGDAPVVEDAGDRILVLKWPYDVGGRWLGPQRWDVVVFKDPKDGETNFIKRLLGLPGEVLQIVNGNLYTAPVESVRADILEALSPQQSASDPSILASGTLSDEQLMALADVLTIRRKSDVVAQSSLWMLHYDHDFIPVLDQARGRRSIEGFDPPYWEGATREDVAAWDAGQPVVRFDPSSDPERLFRLELKGPAIRDDYGYNNVYQGNAKPEAPRPVDDVRLRFVVFPGKRVGSSEGELVLSLSTGSNQFQARILEDGKVFLEKRLHDSRGGYWIDLKNKVRDSEPLVPGVPRLVEFENLDYRVALRVDGQEIVHTSDDQFDYRPILKRLLRAPYDNGVGGNAAVSIAARAMGLEIRHLQVHRDVFYRSENSGQSGSGPGWGVAKRPILLRAEPQDYFCCGDNSPQSQDSRWWTDVCSTLRKRGDYQYGTVPRDQLIGRAFFVYWPGGLRFTRETPAVIPNVGRMRIIR